MGTLSLARIKLARAALAVALLASTPACIAAAAAGAGAGAAVYFTTRGASAVVPSSVDYTAEQTRKVLAMHNVQLTTVKSEDAGAKQELGGSMGGSAVSVELQKESSGTTKVEVSVQKSPVEWDKDLAKQILTEIAERS